MYRCKNCNSSKIQSLQWVEINTGESLGIQEENNLLDNWCPSCETHGDIEYKKEEINNNQLTIKYD